jgi:acetyl esterase/lipase
MHYETIAIWDHFKGNIHGRATLDAYIPEHSPEISFIKNKKAVLVCPGGGYYFVSKREGEAVALAFAAQGFNAFVLTYEVAPAVRHPQPILDVSRAVCLIRENAEKWHTDPDKISVCGFSAGGHLAASLGVFWREAYIRDMLGIPEGLNKPNSLILCYPVITSRIGLAHRGSFYNLLGEGREESVYKTMSLENFVSGDTPPAFLWHTFDDGAVPVENSLLFAQGLKKADIPFELHVFPQGAHGLSLCDERTSTGPEHLNPHAAQWFELCVAWLKKFA